MNDLTGKTILTIGSAILVVPIQPLLIAAALGGAAVTYYVLEELNK